MDLSGQIIGGRYHIIKPLGQGGMAVVYQAYDTRLERFVAIKVIRSAAIPPEQFAGILRRFEREAKAIAALDHTNIVKVYDYGEHEGAPYLVIQYLAGGTLKQRTGKPMPYQETARLLLPIAQALAYAHQKGIVHRDVKPANILISQQGVPMLSDFGIARLLEHAETTQLTGTGVSIGTPEYMPPEQWTGHPLPQSDIYALGVVFYELITGRKPYTADTPAAVLIKHLNDPLPRPKLFVPDIPQEVENVLYKALAKQPEERFTTMGEFVRVLEMMKEGRFDDQLFSQSRVDSAPQTFREAETVTRLPGAGKITTPFPLTEDKAQTPRSDQAKGRRMERKFLWLLGGLGGLAVLLVVAVGLVGYFMLTDGRLATQQTQTAVAQVEEKSLRMQTVAAQTEANTHKTQTAIEQSLLANTQTVSFDTLTQIPPSTWTNTPLPTETETLPPTATETLPPTATMTPQPTETPLPTPTPQPPTAVMTGPKHCYDNPRVNIDEARVTFEGGERMKIIGRNGDFWLVAIDKSTGYHSVQHTGATQCWVQEGKNMRLEGDLSAYQ